EHLIHNPEPHWQSALERLGEAGRKLGTDWGGPVGDWVAAYGDQRLAVTLILLLFSSALALDFFRGFTRGVLRVAMVVVGIYLVLNVIVIGAGVNHLLNHP